jgi:hypothetical protein
MKPTKRNTIINVPKHIKTLTLNSCLFEGEVTIKTSGNIRVTNSFFRWNPNAFIPPLGLGTREINKRKRGKK